MIAPEMPVPQLLEVIAKTGQRKFMVVLDHHLLGVITLADLIQYLTLGDLNGRMQPRSQKK
jgi:CBS domain-containing protein